MPIYYIETELGACLHSARSIKQARKERNKEIVADYGVKLIRKATKEDITDIQAIGGYVPEKGGESQ